MLSGCFHSDIVPSYLLSFGFIQSLGTCILMRRALALKQMCNLFLCTECPSVTVETRCLVIKLALPMVV